MAPTQRNRSKSFSENLGPTVHRSTLRNGLPVLIVPLPHLHTATISYLVRAGSMYETPQTNGLGHLTEHMVFRGTKDLPSTYKLNDAIERLGGTLNGATQADLTEYELTLPPENVAKGIALVSSVVREPILEGLEIEQRIIREEILEDLDENGVQTDIDNVSRELLFTEHPLGFPITGSIDTVESFCRADVENHIASHYTATNSVLVVAGAFDPKSIETQIIHSFSEMKEGKKVHAPRFLHSATPKRRVHVNDTDSQTEVRLSFHCAGAQSADLPALRLVDRILDDGLSSRLHQKICDELALAYDVFCGLDIYEDRGVLEIGSAVEHDKTEALLSACLDLIDDISRSPVGDDELEKAKVRYLWDLRSSIDSPDAIASYYGTSALFDLDRSLEQAASEVEAVTPEDILRVCSDTLGRGNAFVTTIGVQSEKNLESLQRLLQR